MKTDRLRGGLGLASEAGVTDSDYVIERSGFVDFAFLGGFHTDEETTAAAYEMIQRGRNEFVYEDAVGFICDEVSRLRRNSPGIGVGLNVRASSFDSLARVGKVAREYGCVLEINAHCRQDEMVEVGCGHSLLRESQRLADWTRRLSEMGVTVGVKTRAEVVDDAAVAREFEDAGGDFLHIDCMDSPDAVDDVARATDLFVIANNGVRSGADAADYFERGADMVSTARAARRLDDLADLYEEVRRCPTLRI
ncbi:MAG: dihydropyrimidine dehydrogenase [Halobacteria archaeon]|nr:dihydropyrimidine dehydrogenase [Halobacteria archaeon]